MITEQSHSSEANRHSASHDHVHKSSLMSDYVNHVLVYFPYDKDSLALRTPTKSGDHPLSPIPDYLYKTYLHLPSISGDRLLHTQPNNSKILLAVVTKDPFHNSIAYKN